MSKRAVDARLHRRGRAPTLSDAQEKLLIGHLIHHRLELKAVERRTLTQFAHGYLGMKLRHQYISDLLKRYHLSLQRSLPRASRMVDEEVVEGAMKIIRELRAERWNPKAILVMDETGIWSNTLPKKTFHFINWFEYFILFAQLWKFRLFSSLLNSPHSIDDLSLLPPSVVNSVYC
jgi:hypothetical protein